MNLIPANFKSIDEALDEVLHGTSKVYDSNGFEIIFHDYYFYRVINQKHFTTRECTIKWDYWDWQVKETRFIDMKFSIRNISIKKYLTSLKSRSLLKLLRIVR